MPKTSTLSRIKEATSAVCKVMISDIIGPSREQEFAIPRQIVQYLGKKYMRANMLPYSHGELVRCVARINHTTSVSAQKRIPALLSRGEYGLFLADTIAKIEALIDDPNWTYSVDMAKREPEEKVMHPPVVYKIPPLEDRLPPLPSPMSAKGHPFNPLIRAVANKPKFDPLWSNVKPVG